MYHDVDLDKCKETDRNELNLFNNDENALNQAQSNAQKISANKMIKAILAVFESKGQTSKDTGRYLKSSIDAVERNPEFYKDTWVYEFMKKNNIIKENNNIM